MNTKIKTSDYLRILPRSDGYAVYHSLFGCLCIVDENIKDILELLYLPMTREKLLNKSIFGNEDILDSFLKIFKNKHFLIDEEEDERLKIRDKIKDIDCNITCGNQVGVVQLITSNDRNHNSKYNFNSDIYSGKERSHTQKSSNNKNLCKEDAKAYINSVIEIFKKNNKHNLSIQFYGGEPLLNWEAIKYILKEFERGEKNGMNIQYSIVTTGTLFTEEILKYLKEYDVAVVVSIDPPRIKDGIFINGKNAYEKIKKGICFLNNHNNRVVFNSILSEDTFDYFNKDIVDFAIENYVFEIGVLLDLSPAFYQNKGYDKIVDRLWDVYLFGQSSSVLVTGYWHIIFQQILYADVYKARSYKTCSGAGAQLSIEPNGEVFACKSSSGYFGNIAEPEKIFSSSNYKKYALRSFLNPIECRNCEIENFCSGFCFGPLEKKYGDIYAVEKNVCDVYKEITKRLIEQYPAAKLENYSLGHSLIEALYTS